MELYHGNVLFTGTLLGLDQSGGVVDADNKAASDLGVQSSRVASLLDLEDLLDPSDNLMGGWVRWFVKVDNSIVLMHIDWTGSW